MSDNLLQFNASIYNLQAENDLTMPEPSCLGLSYNDVSDNAAMIPPQISNAYTAIPAKG